MAACMPDVSMFILAVLFYTYSGLLMVPFIIILASYECPEGYTLNGVICYHWNPDYPLDWYSAREMCSQEGADLATIQSEEEQHFLSGKISNIMTTIIEHYFYNSD